MTHPWRIGGYGDHRRGIRAGTAARDPVMRPLAASEGEAGMVRTGKPTSTTGMQPAWHGPKPPFLAGGSPRRKKCEQAADLFASGLR